MKRLLRFVLLTFFVALPLYAAGRAQNLVVPGPMQLGSNTLPAGEYSMSWTATGDTAPVIV